MTVTSADVARAAGVSRATVSYVLNDVPGRSLSAETRAAVLRVARELGYQPNALATSLKRGRSNTVLFPMPGVPMNHVLTALFGACTDALAPRGLSLVLDMSRHGDPAAQADAWAGLAPAAVLDLVLHHDDPALQRLRARGVPVLSAAPAGETDWESSGDRFAREQRLAQVRYLASRGHRTIRSILPRTVPSPVDPRTLRRLLTDTRNEAASAGARLVVERLDLDEIAGAVAAWKTLPDAVAAHNDTYALAVMTALQHRGISVPNRVAVIGADDEPAGRAVTPALTTVAGDFGEFAEAAADAVMAALDGRTSPPLPVPGVVLVRRASA
jgi:DNA-binding LacI/PurR family transcriptional regulator